MEALTYFELATFTGGLYDDPPNFRFRYAHRYTQADFIKAFNHQSAPPQGLPAPYSYSNSGYGLLGQVLMAQDGYPRFSDRRVFRANFERWIDRAILQPLGMDCTGPNPAAMPAVCRAPRRMASGYHLSRGRYVAASETWPWFPWGPAGALRSDAGDMVRYIGAYLGNATVEGQNIPSRLTEAMAIARHPTNVVINPRAARPFRWKARQGYAWIVDPARPHYFLRFAKDGGTDNFSSCITGVPAKNVGVVVIANLRMRPTSIPCRLTREIAGHTHVKNAP